MFRAIVLGLIVLGGVAASSALADTGVAVDVGEIQVSRKLSRGGRYELPAIGVRNPGTETTTYQMGVSYLQDQDGRRTPSGWISFSPDELTLAPGETRRVGISLDIPANARPDDYEALLQAAVAPQGEGASIGAAAGTRLKFTVKPSNILHAWQLQAETWFRDSQPWASLLPLVAVLLVLAWWLRRHVTISVRRRQ